MPFAMPPPISAAVVSGDSCKHDVGGAVPAVLVEPLSGLQLGGHYHATLGWQPPGEMLVGQLRFDWGQRLTTTEPTFSHIVQRRRSGGELVTAAGCSFLWVTAWGAHGIAGAALYYGAQITSDAKATPYTFPDIDGWRFLPTGAKRLYGSRMIGAWLSPDNKHSRLYEFDATGQTNSRSMLAELPFKISAMSILAGVDDPSFHLDVFSDAAPKSPTIYVRLVYFPDRHIR